MSFHSFIMNYEYTAAGLTSDTDMYNSSDSADSEDNRSGDEFDMDIIIDMTLWLLNVACLNLCHYVHIEIV